MNYPTSMISSSRILDAAVETIGSGGDGRKKNGGEGKVGSREGKAREKACAVSSN